MKKSKSLLSPKFEDIALATNYDQNLPTGESVIIECICSQPSLTETGTYSIFIV